ncbi:MAG: hypothetical protein WD598_09545 [Acidimicrobiia bacterium]
MVAIADLIPDAAELPVPVPVDLTDDALVELHAHAAGLEVTAEVLGGVAIEQDADPGTTLDVDLPFLA